jgi:hypothetical protein
LSLELESIFGLWVAQVDLISRFRQTKKHADLFKELSDDRDPVTQRLVRIAISAENPSGIVGGQPATSI